MDPRKEYEARFARCSQRADHYELWRRRTGNPRFFFAVAGPGVLEWLMRMLLRFLPAAFGVVVMVALLPLPVFADSNPAHMQKNSEKPQTWPGGVIPYDISKLTAAQQTIALRAMQRWMDTGAKIRFVPRTREVEYVNFTGKTNAGNNTSQVGFKNGVRTDVNITAFWWGQREWMPAHELGHVLGFFHEHERWDRDRFVTIHYENIKSGRADDYDWIPKTSWIVSSLPYDYRSIMHYRICWASKCEDQCTDGVGSSPCSVIEPVDTQYDGVIGQWTENGISALDGERARLVYGTRASPVAPKVPNH
ncbi:MAG TPA: M12 family metallopeptidase [Candidatus Saccharimonadales bacterium]|nr:M12 family metallopeptidase [Candidatus Saccharimonadales bacterium]